jgi:hypothetical protein
VDSQRAERVFDDLTRLEACDDVDALAKRLTLE